MSFLQWFKDVRLTMKADIDAVFNRDPAARSTFEVVLTYSGLARDLDVSRGSLVL